MEDWLIEAEFYRYLNYCSIYELESMCDTNHMRIIIEDGLITGYRKEK